MCSKPPLGREGRTEHEPDCDDKDFCEPWFCQCTEPSGRDDPQSISNLMAEGPPVDETTHGYWEKGDYGRGVWYDPKDD
jgi:hypothetical protein